MLHVEGYDKCGMPCMAFLLRSFHWLGNSTCYTIISFNISIEVYGQIPLLKQMYDMLVHRLDHGHSVLRGMLCYFRIPHMFGTSYTSNLWVVRDYGIKESWIQLYEIRDTKWSCFSHTAMYVCG